MKAIWKWLIGLTYGLIALQILLGILLVLLQDWRTWACLAVASIVAYLVLPLVEPKKTSAREDIFERQPHDPAPRHVDGREWNV